LPNIFYFFSDASSILWVGACFFLDVLPTKKGGVFLLYLLFWFFGGESLSLLGGFFKKNYEEEGFCVEVRNFNRS